TRGLRGWPWTVNDVVGIYLRIIDTYAGKGHIARVGHRERVCDGVAFRGQYARLGERQCWILLDFGFRWIVRVARRARIIGILRNWIIVRIFPPHCRLVSNTAVV